MTPKPESLYTELLALQGVTLPPDRAESVARTLATQMQAEREQTGALEFEREPSAFVRALEGGAR